MKKAQLTTPCTGRSSVPPNRRVPLEPWAAAAQTGARNHSLLEPKKKKKKDGGRVRFFIFWRPGSEKEPVGRYRIEPRDWVDEGKGKAPSETRDLLLCRRGVGKSIRGGVSHGYAKSRELVHAQRFRRGFISDRAQLKIWKKKRGSRGQMSRQDS